MRKARFSLADYFLRYFDVALASSKTDRDAVARLRHRVYCEEFGYEPRSADGREVDDYDGHSVSCIVTHRRTGTPAGCVRLICASDTDRLALEDNCLESVHCDYRKSLETRREDVCEFSRLAVDPDFRRRAGEARTLLGAASALRCSRAERRTYSAIGIVCYLSAFAAADLLGRRDVYAMMAPSLPRLLHRSGIPVEQAGSSMEYHGRRAPYFVSTNAVVAHMSDELRPLYRTIRGHIGAGLLDSVAVA